MPTSGTLVISMKPHGPPGIESIFRASSSFFFRSAASLRFALQLQGQMQWNFLTLITVKHVQTKK